MIFNLLKIRELGADNQAAIEIQCSPEARDILRHYHNESIRLRNGQLHDIEGELGRWRENACRLALILCVADNSEAAILTGEQAARAVRLARWAQLSALKVMTAGRMQRRLARIEKLRELLEKCDGEITLRDLAKSHGFTSDEVERLAADFPQLLKIESKQNPKGGPLSYVLKKPDRQCPPN